jgi:DNA-binding LacI/PurR family transcriptional regulator
MPSKTRKSTQARPRGRPKEPHAAFRRFADELRRNIIRRGFKCNDILPSLSELALKYRTGIDVVREAIALLKQEGRIAKTPIGRFAIVADYGAQPEMSPRGAILEVVTSLLHEKAALPNECELQTGIEVGAGELAAPLMIAHEDHFRHSLPSGFLESPLSGIVIRGTVSRKALAEYQRLAVPVVLADQPPGVARLRAACVDNHRGAREIVERVVALGHKRIAFLRRFSFVRQGVDPDSREREEGVREALAAAGHPLADDSVYLVFHTETVTSPNIQAVAGSRAPYTAAIAADSTIAALLAQAAKAAGRKVPRDLSILCFQGSVPEPKFSGMAVDFRELGRRAVHLLRSTDAREVVRVPPQWVDVGTLAAAP